MAEEINLRLVLHASAGVVTDEMPELVRGLPDSCAKGSWERGSPVNDADASACLAGTLKAARPCRQSPGDR